MFKFDTSRKDIALWKRADNFSATIQNKETEGEHVGCVESIVKHVHIDDAPLMQPPVGGRMVNTSEGVP